jgi:Family of unknown function (DUF5317)
VFGLAVPVLLALGIALMRGGSLAPLTQQRIHWWPLALVALGIQIPLYSLPLGEWLPATLIGPLATLATTGLVLTMLLRNATGSVRVACLIAAAGVALNLTAMALNGGVMPRRDDLSPRPLDRAALASTINNTAPSLTSTRLPWLGDTLAQPTWLPFANVVSPGDILLSLGAAAWAYQISRKTRAPYRVPR